MELFCKFVHCADRKVRVWRHSIYGGVWPNLHTEAVLSDSCNSKKEVEVPRLLSI